MVDGRRYTSAYPAPQRTGVLPQAVLQPQTSASSAALAWPAASHAGPPPRRDLSRPASGVPAPVAHPGLLARRAISHVYHRIEVADQGGSLPAGAPRRLATRTTSFRAPFERGTVPYADTLEKTLRFQPSRTDLLPLYRSPDRKFRRIGNLSFTFAALFVLAFSTAARADSRPDFNRDAKPILRTQAQLLHYVRVHFDVQETGYARTPGDDTHAPPPPYIFRAKPRGASGPYTITLFIAPGPPGHVLYVKKTGPLAAESNPPAAAYPPGDSSAPFNSAGEPPSSAPASASSSNEAVTTSPNGFVGVDSSTPSGPIKAPAGNATAPDLAPPPETTPNR
jgi:hypothetical protein